jgi:hypothetical protein
MHPWTIAIAGAVALSLAGTSPGGARPKLGSTVMPTAAPVFWPDAPANLIEYLLFPKGQDERFWRYGYGAIMNTTFADPRPRRLPFAGKIADARVADASSAVRPALSPSAADPCGGGSPAADADAWIARIEQAITPAAPQREVLAQLRSALVQAIERITAACPSPPPATPTERLQAIQDRIWAMRDSLLTIRQPVESFYNSLTQEQHWRLNRDSDTREIGARSGDGLGEMCADPAAIDERPMRAIERAVAERATARKFRRTAAGIARHGPAHHEFLPDLSAVGSHGPVCRGLGSPRCDAVRGDDPGSRRARLLRVDGRQAEGEFPSHDAPVETCWTGSHRLVTAHVACPRRPRRPVRDLLQVGERGQRRRAARRTRAAMSEGVPISWG